jgi:hypothetical protein
VRARGYRYRAGPIGASDRTPMSAL